MKCAAKKDAPVSFAGGPKRPTTLSGAATLFIALVACGTDADMGAAEPDRQPAAQ